MKKLSGLAFRSPLAMTRLQKPKTSTQEMLKKDILRRAELGFELDTFGINLDMYVFLD